MTTKERIVDYATERKFKIHLLNILAEIAEKQDKPYEIQKGINKMKIEVLREE